MMPTQVQEIAPLDLKRRLDAGERLVLLDVREPVERALVAIPTTDATLDLFVPMGQIVENLETLRNTVMNAQAPLVVYCHHGARSMYAARWLAAQGVAGVTNLTGGIDAYSLGADPRVSRY